MKDIQCLPQRQAELPDRQGAAGRLVGEEGKFEVVDDSVHHGIFGEEGDDAEQGATLFGWIFGVLW